MTSPIINVLVTGSNGGLGLGICLRLIDDFLKTRAATDSLNLIYTTRSSRKGSDTLKVLQNHLQRHHPASQHHLVTLQPENVELTNLLSIQDLTRKLVASDLRKIDVVICNAGVGGWSGIDWFTAVPDILLDMRSSTVWPRFKLGTVGAITKPQIPAAGEGAVLPEPPLGEIFCANLFGHYMLLHWLMPLLRACVKSAPAKIIWVSSVEPQSYHFDVKDLQGLTTDAPYESSKRATDLLALTSNQPATSKSVTSFESCNSSQRTAKSIPGQHVYHPGIVVTSVISLYWIISQAYLLGIYLARWIGTPWSTVEPYNAAHGATWLALTSEEDIREAEREAHVLQTPDVPSDVESGKIKWGTAINRFGKTTVRATEVDRWGLAGTGAPYASTWWGGTSGLGRKPEAVEAKVEDVHGFVEEGAKVWEDMETMRRDWEKKIEEYEGRK